VRIRFNPTWDVEQLAADALAQAAGGNTIQAIFVDPVTAVAPPLHDRHDRRRDLELSLVSRRLKGLAHSLACPVVAVSPTRLLQPKDDAGRLRRLLAEGAGFGNPEVEDAIRKRRPRLEHLVESGLEQETDLVMGLLNLVADFQEELDPETRQVFKKMHSGLVELAALKNRYGPLDSVELEMDFKSGLFSDPTR
jgi:replicative DNA helicase